MNTITSKIYEALFDKTQAEMIAEANQHSPLPHIISGDEDEAMRDCLSVEALSALSRIEGDMANYIHQVSVLPDITLESFTGGLLEFIQNGAKVIRSEYPNNTIPLWHDDTL